MRTDTNVNIYLDVDGVLINNSNVSAYNTTPANYASEFIRFIVNNYPDTTYWLTTRCKGDATKLLQQLKPMFDTHTFELIKTIKPTTWEKSKTEAIDFTEPFLWFDDYILYDAKQVLIKNGCLDNHIKVDLRSNENQLANFIYSFPLPNII